ncbi:hypothetical protein BG006_011388 [Podila minutissima]|uniref:BTB domain-containing protein n=1 Tax=Podila minutissima TaxID=64525 RepID=A0A9P5VI47_9FUNG|nr:hypothetical protein BG006_011388 [Podila minutissima]
MCDSKQEGAYVPKGPIVEEAFVFSIRLSTTTTGEQRFKFDSELGPFAVIADVSTGKLAYKVDTTASNYMVFGQSKQCSVEPVKGDTPFTTSLFYRYLGEYEIASLSLSTERLPAYASYDLSFTKAMMTRLGNSSTAPEISSGTTVSATKTFHARKIVLSQWPYFRTVLAEGGSGKKEIRIKDVNANTFQQTLFFPYDGEFHDPPCQISESTDPVKAKKASWEGLYLAAHRYRIDDLRKQALDEILGTWTIQVPIESVEQDGEYQLVIVMSTMKHIPSTSGAAGVDALKNEVAIAKIKANESKSTVVTLLRDIYSSIDDVKAIETLIHVGSQFPEVKEAVLSYIANNMRAIFAGRNDLFGPFVQHPRCHELLVEVMLRSHNMGP